MTDEFNPPVATAGEDEEPKPTFDLNRVGYGWTRKYMRAQTFIGSKSIILESEPKPGISPVEKMQLTIGKIEASEAIVGLMEERDQLLVQVLVDVPRSWLLPNAPENLDWSQVDSLDWLISGRMNDLLSALQDAANPKN